MLLAPVEAAQAVLNSPNAQIARSPDAALRRSIPAFNPTVRGVCFAGCVLCALYPPPSPHTHARTHTRAHTTLQVKDVQERIESVAFLLRIPNRKPYGVHT